MTRQMQLSELVGHAVPRDVRISGLALDSRKVERDYLFAALKGALSDGANYIDQVAQKGAAAVLLDAGRDVQVPEGVVDVRAPIARQALAHMAARYFEHQPEQLVSVTGTNGKSSTVDLFGQLGRLVGLNAAGVGTLGVAAGGAASGFGLTTPDTISFHEILADLAHKGISHAAFEASSHGLAQYRVDGARLKAAGFTNITRDHLDYHGSFEAYLFAKLRLIGEVLPPDGVAVINMDTDVSAQVLEIAWARGLSLCLVGEGGRDLKVLKRQATASGQALTLQADGETYEIDFPLVGGFQVANAVMAAGLLHATGISWAEILPQLAHVTAVPGRLERISDAKSAFTAVVDYAHTPDALSTAIAALRPHTAGRMIVVFGCGGDRDAGKRPMMGQIASDAADVAIVTDDNPRSEDPAQIRKEILAACPDAVEIGDRHAAIEKAFSLAAPGDTVLIAGKGHETGQIVAGETLPFDDRSVTRALLQQGEAA